MRIVPQIRRQVPEPWRRRLPLPFASALYGALLGLGFTTFVLTWAVWALAAVSVALGDTTAGLAIGVAFGVGRALPVVAMAPSSWRGLGARLLATMAEHPASLRIVRAADAMCLAACAVLLAAGPAYAAVVDSTGTDPSTAGADVGLGAARHRGGRLKRRAGDRAPGRHPRDRRCVRRLAQRIDRDGGDPRDARARSPVRRERGRRARDLADLDRPPRHRRKRRHA